MLFISFVLLCLLLLACNNNEPYPSERYESTATTWYKDADGDGYSDGTTQTSVERPSSDYYKESELTAISGDCNDNDDSVNPGATEVCNSIDDDCDDSVDEDVTSTFYQDSDGDGYGNATVSTQACTAPSDYVADNTDCDDSNASVNPGATEVCGDGIDQDCNGNDLFCTGGWDSGFWDQDVWGE